LAKELEKAATALDKLKAQAIPGTRLGQVFHRAEERLKQRKRKDRVAPLGRPPKGLTPGQRMKRSLDTKVGQRTYALRGQTVEPVNGQIKADGAGQMLRRGLVKVHSDFTAACIAHNLKKLWGLDRP
jgi:hypothetical protein